MVFDEKGRVIYEGTMPQVVRKYKIRAVLVKKLIETGECVNGRCYDYSLEVGNESN